MLLRGANSRKIRENPGKSGKIRENPGKSGKLEKKPCRAVKTRCCFAAPIRAEIRKKQTKMRKTKKTEKKETKPCRAVKTRCCFGVASLQNARKLRSRPPFSAAGPTGHELRIPPRGPMFRSRAPCSAAAVVLHSRAASKKLYVGSRRVFAQECAFFLCI
jgi:hypothetical protein